MTRGKAIIMGQVTSSLTGKVIGDWDNEDAEGIGCGNEIDHCYDTAIGMGGGRCTLRKRKHEFSTPFRSPVYCVRESEPEGAGDPYHTLHDIDGESIVTAGVTELDLPVYKSGLIYWLKDRLWRLKRFIKERLWAEKK